MADDRDLDDLDDLDLDSLDDEEYLRAWAAADRRAADVLAQAIPDVLASDAPMDELAPAAERVRSAIAARTEEGRYFETACGWAAPPDLDVALWLQAAGSTISPWEDADTDPELQAAVFSLEYADWLALIVGLVRRGVGAELSAELMVEDLEAMPEIEIDELPEGSDVDLALEILVPLWQVLGALDAGRRLTALGRWGLPRALHLVWSTSGDDDTSSDDPLEAFERLEPRGSRLDDEATETAIELLRTGPMTLAQLRSACGGSGVFTDEGTLYRSIIWRPEVWALEDDRFVHLPSVADGLVLTHRLTAQELELSILDPRVDLELYSLIAEEGLPLESGGTLVAVHAGGPEQMPAGWICKLTGPDGWLAGRAAGDLIGLRLTDGVVSMETIDETTDDDRPVLLDIARSVARLADPVNRHGLEGVTSDDIVMMARAERPDVLSRPGPPLSEVLSHSGLEEHLGEYGVPGTRWYGEPPLAADQRVAYYAWRDALRAFEHGAEPREEDLEAALGLVGLALDLAATDAALHAPCAPLLEQLLRRAEGAAPAGPLYLLAREAEARLDGPAYVALLEQAVAADSSLEDAVADLAEVRAIQGDAAAAHRLFGLAGVDASYPDRAALGPFLRAPEGETGRNRPCPCGSGKKYKVCHGRDARHPLADRGRWLWVKIKSFAQRSINRDELFGWAELLSGEDRDDDAIARAMDDPTTWDFAVFDGDILARFLTLYGDLLPADEAALARTWQGTPRRLLEVGSTHLNGVSARDMVTNATVELRDRTLPRSVERGTLLLGRFLDPGDGALQPWDDPLGIPRMWRPRVLAALRSGADPRDLAALLAPSGPPELVTTDGEELLFCVARYRVDDLDAAWASLATVLSGDDDTLHLGGDDNGAPIRGTVTHDADLLVLQTMSIERMRSLQEVLVAAAPDAVLVDESSRTMADLPDRGPGTAGAPVALSPADLAAIVRATEDRWIEDSIPALGGRTPRQAASDPALRGELLDLLNDIEITQRGADFAMDTDRVRRELGL